MEPRLDLRVLEAPSDGAFQRWTSRGHSASGALYEALTALVRDRLQGCDPEDLITVIDEIAEDPEYLGKRKALTLTSAQRVALLRKWPQPVATTAMSPELEPRFQLDRSLREVLRLQLVLRGALAVRAPLPSTAGEQPGTYEAAVRMPPRDPFVILDDDTAPARLISAKLAGTRLDVLMFAWPSDGDGLGAALERAVVQETIAAARRFLALLVFLVEIATDIDPRVGVDVLPAEERLVQAPLVAEERALRDMRNAALDGAKRRSAG